MNATNNISGWNIFISYVVVGLIIVTGYSIFHAVGKKARNRLVKAELDELEEQALAELEERASEQARINSKFAEIWAAEQMLGRAVYDQETDVSEFERSFFNPEDKS